MFRGLLSLSLAVLTPVFALAGPTEEFIAARAKHKVFDLSTPQELKDLKEGAYLELQAKVSGSIRGENGAVSMIARFGDFSQTVNAAKAPDWLIMGVTEVRMLVKATMVDTQLVPALELVASVPEIDIARIDETMRIEAEKKAEMERKKAEAARIQLDFESQSRGQGFRDYRSSPPAGSTFGGAIGSGGSGGSGGNAGNVIGGANTATTKQLLDLVPEYTGLILENNKAIAAGQAQLIAECVLAYSSTYGVDARLVMAIIKHESNFNPRVTSHAGAQGLGQLMPDTARSLGITDPFDIVQNVYGTVRTIRGHLERQGKESKDVYEQLVRALAAYNAGPGAVKKYGGLPPYAETEAYVEKVMRTYFKLSGQK
jgi:hypothetical protein